MSKCDKEKNNPDRFEKIFDEIISVPPADGVARIERLSDEEKQLKNKWGVSLLERVIIHGKTDLAIAMINVSDPHEILRVDPEFGTSAITTSFTMPNRKELIKALTEKLGENIMARYKRHIKLAEEELIDLRKAGISNPHAEEVIVSSAQIMCPEYIASPAKTLAAGN